MEVNDQQLFEKVKSGNKIAFESLFRKYYAPIAGFILKYVRDRDSAEEVAQDLFISFWENAPRLQITTSFKSYLYTSAKNYALNYIKKSATRDKYHQLAWDATESETEETDSTRSNSFNQLVNKALDTLPEKCREIFIMSKYEGLTYDEIAEYMGLSKKTVENQMGIGLRKIRDWIQPYLSNVYE